MWKNAFIHCQRTVHLFCTEMAGLTAVRKFCIQGQQFWNQFNSQPAVIVYFEAKMRLRMNLWKNLSGSSV